MKKLVKLSLILLVVGMTSVAFAADDDKMRAGVVLYKLKKDVTSNELKSVNALIETFASRKDNVQGTEIKMLHLKDKGMEQKVIKLLEETGAVEFAEPDMVVPPSVVPNDPEFSKQWHHTTINSVNAWDTITSPSDMEAVKVCVLDTGVDQDHPDLIDNLLPGYNANGLSSVEDQFGHGTFTTGVLGAVGNNGMGVSGVLWDINIIPVQINISSTNSSAYTSTMANAIRWCADQGVKVVNLSYRVANSATIEKAASYLRDQGGLLFMASGNTGTYHDATSYSDWESFIVVGSTNTSDTKSSFSDYGPYIDLVAPGERIYSTFLDGEYILGTGTSFVSPMVAGVAAMIYGINPDFTPEEVEDILFSSAVDLGESGEDDLYGHGRIDAQGAVNLAVEYMNTPNEAPVAIATATYLNDHAPRVVRFDGSGSTDDGVIVNYHWDFGDGNSSDGMVVEYTYENPGQYLATLTVTDEQDVGTTSETLTIEVPFNAGPIVPPSELSGSVDGNSVVLTWVDNSDNEDGFIIERAKKENGTYQFSPIATTEANIDTFTDVVEEKGKYQYRVIAFNTSNDSDYTNTIKLKIKKNISDINRPKKLSGSVDGISVVLTWIDNSDNEDGFIIERAKKENGGYQFLPIAETGADIDTFTDSVKEVGQYKYRVKAFNTFGFSKYSNKPKIKINN